MLLDGTFGVWFLDKLPLGSHRSFDLPRTDVDIMPLILARLLFFGAGNHRIRSWGGERHRWKGKILKLLVRSIRVGAHRFPGNEPSNYRLSSLQTETAKVSVCCYLVNRRGKSNVSCRAIFSTEVFPRTSEQGTRPRNLSSP
jgi:hypothetical protein